MSSTTDQDQTPKPPVNVNEVLKEAAAGEVDSSRIAELSDPNRDQLREFRSAWDELPTATRRELIREMIRQGNKNLALDFDRYLRAVLRDEDPEIRALAIQGLWEDDSPSLLVELCAMADREDDAAVQEQVAAALGRFSYRAEMNELKYEDAERARSALFQLRRDGRNWMVRRRALESLAYISGDEEIKAEIADAAESDFEMERAGALVAMGRNLDERWLPTVLGDLHNEDPDIRCEAARAVGLFGAEVAIEDLSRLTEDEDEEIRQVAVEAIGRIGGRRAIDALRYLRKEGPSDLKGPIKDAMEEAEFLSESTGMER